MGETIPHVSVSLREIMQRCQPAFGQVGAFPRRARGRRPPAARTLSDTFAGIDPVHTPAFIVMQFIGAGAATALFRWLVPGRSFP